MTHKLCNKCMRLLTVDKFYRHKTNKDGLFGKCKNCHYRISYSDTVKRLDDWRYRLFFYSKTNARKRGVEHTISQSDIILSDTCVYLGVKIDYSVRENDNEIRAYNIPSLDRIDSTKGYIPGNIQVISYLANRMKQDATIDQLVSFALGILRVHGG